MTISERIKSLREGLGLSQWEFARQTGISVYKITRIERGLTDLRLEDMKRIIDTFDLVPEFFFSPTPADADSISE